MESRREGRGGEEMGREGERENRTTGGEERRRRCSEEIMQKRTGAEKDG